VTFWSGAYMSESDNVTSGKSTAGCVELCLPFADSAWGINVEGRENQSRVRKHRDTGYWFGLAGRGRSFYLDFSRLSKNPHSKLSQQKSQSWRRRNHRATIAFSGSTRTIRTRLRTLSSDYSDWNSDWIDGHHPIFCSCISGDYRRGSNPIRCRTTTIYRALRGNPGSAIATFVYWLLHGPISGTCISVYSWQSNWCVKFHGSK